MADHSKLNLGKGSVVIAPILADAADGVYNALVHLGYRQVRFGETDPHGARFVLFSDLDPEQTAPTLREIAGSIRPDLKGESPYTMVSVDEERTNGEETHLRLIADL